MDELEAQAGPSLATRIEELKRLHGKRKSEREKAIDQLLNETVDSFKLAVNKFNQQVESVADDPVNIDNNTFHMSIFSLLSDTWPKPMDALSTPNLLKSQMLFKHPEWITTARSGRMR
jgi:type VI protein secretion system component VasK